MMEIVVAFLYIVALLFAVSFFVFLSKNNKKIDKHKKSIKKENYKLIASVAYRHGYLDAINKNTNLEDFSEKMIESICNEENEIDIKKLLEFSKK